MSKLKRIITLLLNLYTINVASSLEDRRRVVFSGADGSGKTTVSKLLAFYIFKYKYNSTCVHWFRGSHLLASILARFTSYFETFRGNCNPYYRICIPKKLRGLWVHVEFWSLLPHILVRALFKRVCRFLICDRGFLDFIVWVVVTLNYPGLLRGLYGGFLLRLAARERPIYLYAEPGVLAKRADVPREFIVRELAVYNVLAKYVSSCSIDTGAKSPWETLRDVLKCLEAQGQGRRR